MKKIAKIEIDKAIYAIDLTESYDLSIPIDPNKKSPKFYDKNPLKISYYKNKDKIWDIKKGATCNIPIIDIHEEAFKQHSDPLSFYPFGLFGHYTEEGYNLIANTIIKKVHEFEI